MLHVTSRNHTVENRRFIGRFAPPFFPVREAESKIGSQSDCSLRRQPRIAYRSRSRHGVFFAPEKVCKVLAAAGTTSYEPDMNLGEADQACRLGQIQIVGLPVRSPRLVPRIILDPRWIQRIL